MELDSLTHSLGMGIQVFFLDLILSGDNALVIAMACRALPRHLMKKAMILGTGFAIVLRIMLTTMVGTLMQVAFVKLMGAALLLSIAIKLILGDDEEAKTEYAAADQLWSAVMVVVMADLVLSLDNVVALAAAAQGSVLFLVLGLLCSVPLLMYGSLFITRLLDNYPILIPAGGAMLGWIAGQVAVTDPLIADWINTQSPALTVVIPALCVLFVLGESRIMQQTRVGLAEPPALGWFDGIVSRLSRLGTAENEVASQPVLVSEAASASIEPSLPALAVALPLATPALVPSGDLPSEVPPSVAEPIARPRRELRQNSPELVFLLRIVVGLAVVVGVCVLGWLVYHLISQGFLPTPSHPHRRNH
ncbi:MAG TPA: TerC family protein [Chromobacteriaceae bacterium]|nr:TerC family protein [Chromobacteriaceae bacterium]